MNPQLKQSIIEATNGPYRRSVIAFVDRLDGPSHQLRAIGGLQKIGAMLADGALELVELFLGDLVGHRRGTPLL